MSCRWDKIFYWLLLIAYKGSLIWWIVDGFLQLHTFNEISLWLGPWNIALPFIYLIFPWTIIVYQMIGSYDDAEPCDKDALIFLIINSIIYLGLLFCVGLFYWLIIVFWSQIPIQYRVAWIIVMGVSHAVIGWFGFYSCAIMKEIISECGYRIRNKREQRIRNALSKIYDENFNIIKYSKHLNHKFFSERIRTDEFGLQRNEFSTEYKIDDNKDCTICYEPLYNSQVTSLPCCNHKYHFKCLEAWSEEKNICPQDREYLRFLMVKHYHKNYYEK